MSKTDEAIAKRLAAVEPGTVRHSALLCARTFKASWVALGKQLLAVQQGQNYAAWGYARFADYCRQELHIREETARKLTRSYTYLADHAPQTLEPSGLDRSAPPIDVVDLLRQARGRTTIDAEAFAALEADALATAGGARTRQQVLEQLKAADPSGFAPGTGANAHGATAADGEAQSLDPAVAAAEDAEQQERANRPVDPRHAKKVLLLAERLHALLREQPNLSEEEDLQAIDRLAATLRRRVLLGHKASSAASATHLQASGNELYPGEPLH